MLHFLSACSHLILFSVQRWAMEFRWAMWQRDWTHQEWEVSLIISIKDDCFGISDQGNENSYLLFKHYKNDWLQERCPPFHLPEAALDWGGEEISWKISRLQSLVPPWSARFLEWATICTAYHQTASTAVTKIKQHGDNKVVLYINFIWGK